VVFSLFRLKSALFARHLGQSTIACLTAMTQGNFASLTPAHWQVALFTGALAGVFGVGVSFTRLFRLYRPWFSFALITFFSTLLADRLSHPTHYGSAWTEALLTAAGATVVSLLISFGPLGSAVQRLEKPEFRQ
jgi:hypothetical protein